jgi:hypothetical protein
MAAVTFLLLPWVYAAHNPLRTVKGVEATPKQVMECCCGLVLTWALGNRLSIAGLGMRLRC